MPVVPVAFAARPFLLVLLGLCLASLPPSSAALEYPMCAPAPEETTVCVQQSDNASPHAACSAHGFRDRWTGVTVADEHAGRVRVVAGGGESCSPLAVGDPMHKQGVGGSASVNGRTFVVSWYQSDRVAPSGEVVAHRCGIYLAGPSGSTERPCIAGDPPNPGWGSVLP